MKEALNRTDSKSSLSRSNSSSTVGDSDSEYSYDADSDTSRKSDEASVSRVIDEAQNMNLAIARSLFENNPDVKQGERKPQAQQENEAASKIGKWVKSFQEKKSAQDKSDDALTR